MAFGGFSAMGKIATSVDETIDDLTNDKLFSNGNKNSNSDELWKDDTKTKKK
jgi:hypothetical protein